MKLLEKMKSKYGDRTMEQAESFIFISRPKNKDVKSNLKADLSKRISWATFRRLGDIFYSNLPNYEYLISLCY